MQQADQGLIKGCIWKQMVLFAIPILIGNMFQQFYNVADTLIVGKMLDKNALAAVSSSGALIFMMVGFFNGIAMGAGVVISKYFGAKDYKSMRKAIHTNLAFGVIAGIVLTIAGVILTPQILRWMKTPESVLPKSIEYFRIYFMGVTATLLYNICVGILQAVGDSKHPLYYLIVSSICNVVLDLLLVGGFKFGVGAAALATTISQFLSVILCLYRLIHYDTVYRVEIKQLKVEKKMLTQILRLGLPSGVQNSIIAFANIIVQSNINSFGENAVAGCGSYSKIEGFAFLPITCFSMALMTFVGQNLGAKQYERTKKGARFGILCSIIMAEIVGGIIYIFAPMLIRIFSKNQAVISYGVLQSRTEALFYFLLAFAHCIAGIMRGAGKATVPMMVMLITWCGIRITYITVALRFVREIYMIFWAYPLTWGLSSIIFYIYYKKVDWLHAFERK